MKSYFAKLADRATLANVPAASAVYAPRVSDPFEDSSHQQPQLPPFAKSTRPQSAPEPAGFALTPPVDNSRIEAKRPLVETHNRISSEPGTEAPPLQPKQPPENLLSEHTVKNISSREPQSLTDPRREIIADTDSSRVAALTPTQAPGLSVPHSKEDTREESETRTKSPDERISEFQREHAVLLRKADAFMNNLLDVQPQRVTENENKVTNETSPPSISRVERDPVNRLEPVQRLPPTSAPDSDGPSLVIGKLTVEVTPTPPAAPPQPPRIVVRGSRSRGSGVPTGRRFGLGQF